MEGKRNRLEMKKIACIVLLVAMMPFAHGQGSRNYNQRLYDSYVKGEMAPWKEIIQEMNREYERTADQTLLYDLCFAYYGYIGYLISEEEEKAARKDLDLAMKRTDELDEILDGRHDVLALQGALLGYRIVLSKFTSMFSGPKAMRYIKTAYESADTYFNCNVEMGNMLFYTPKFLGGSQTESIQYYQKAVEILETSQLKTERNWIYMNTVLLLANAYKETGQEKLACQLYKQVLEYEPAADWIRKDLYAKCKPQ
jgi:tetratricopeptide (TPR) repeat protein